MKTELLKRALLLVAMLLACVVQSRAEDFEYNGLTYTILTDNTCETKQGSYIEAGNSISGNLVIPETVYNNDKAYSVTTIGEYAFYYCTGLMEVTIPNSVTSIGSSAFYSCSGLTEVTIPNSVTSIGEDAFGYCTGLTEVTIGNSVTEIGTGAFRYCTGLTEVTIPNSVTTIGSSAFFVCTGLKEVTIPNSVTEIGGGAFYDCSGLTEVTIPNSVTSIGNQVFYRCSGLTEVTIPNSVTEIGKDAFYGCSGMTEVTIPNSVTEIGKDAFVGCSGLERVNISDLSAWCNIYYTNASGNPLYYAHHLFLDGTEVTNLVIPETVTKIKVAAFCGCSGLTEVTIGNSVTEIGKDAFYGCSGMTEVTIPNSVTEIGESAFYGCSGLTEVTIPNSVTSIGKYAFYGCSGLTEVTIPNSVTEIGESAFYGCSGLVKSAYPNSISNPFSNGVAVAYPTDAEIEDGIIWGTNKSAIYFVPYKYEGDFIIPNSATKIYGYAFYGCSGLTDVTIPNSVTSIGSSAFYGCSGLTEVIIPNTVTSIGSSAFEGCSGLKWIESQANTPPTIQSNTFSDYTVPLLAASDEYETADYWKNFTIVAISYTPTGTTFEVDGLKYEIISVNDLTCRLYGIDETVTGENVVIPETVVYKNRTFTPTEIKGVLAKSDSSVKSISIPSSTTTISNGMIFCSTLAKLTVSAPITTNIAYVSNIDELVISPSATNISAGLSTNNIGKITIEDSETELTTSNFKCEAKEVYLGRNVSASTFKDMTSLEKVTISDKVTSISNSAFSGCTGLTEVTIPNSVISIGDYAFVGCSGLTEVTIPNSVTEIGTGAFYSCTGLKSVAIGNSVTSIGMYTFSGCTGLTEVTIPNSVTSIGYQAFNKCTGLMEVTIGNSVKTIGYQAFNKCTGLTEVNIPNSVTSISGNAFYGCTRLKVVTIGNSVTSIDTYAFAVCTGITELNFEDGDEDVTIGNYAFTDVTPTTVYLGRKLSSTIFKGNTKLTNITIGEKITSISESAFSGCTRLKVVTIGNSVTKIGKSAFSGCTGLTEVTIPNSVTTISESAFYGCTGLTSLSIPNSVTNIEKSAFYGCSSITYLNFKDGEGNLSFGTNAFTNVAPTEVYFGRQMDFSVVSHTALETVEFGENVTSIASGAFKDGTAIRTVVSRNVTPPTTDDTFGNETYLDGVLYVPDASIEAYQAAAGWKNFWEIKPLSEYSGVEGVVVDEDVETISVDNGAISVNSNSQVRIVALNGTTVYSGRGDARVNVTPGIYVVIVGNTAHKVAVR